MSPSAVAARKVIQDAADAAAAAKAAQDAQDAADADYSRRNGGDYDG